MGGFRLPALPGAVERELHTLSATNLTPPHDVTSAEPNRVFGPANTAFVLPPNGGVVTWYDDVSLRWRLRAIG